MYTKLNDPIATKHGMLVLTEKRVHGIDCYLLVFKPNHGEPTVRSFLDLTMAITALNKTIQNS